MIEKVAKAIYYAAYDQHLDPSYAHPKGFTTLELAWKRCSEGQREFCRHQARRAIAALMEEPPPWTAD